MSGVAGLLAVNGTPVEPAAIARMGAAVAHRGRENQSVFIEGPVGLAHAASHTSIHDNLTSDLFDDGQVVVAADARLDDRGKLADLLGLAADQASDAQLIGGAYLKWGPACSEHLLGDFAFALWDRQNRQLFCARDHFGVKPFYYALDASHFAFGSEIKALRRSGVRTYPIREQAVGEYLASLRAPPGETFYADIHSLLPAHSLTVGVDGRFETHNYWTLSFGGVTPSASPVEDFVRLFDQAVQRRMQSARPVGALLSGGLDSSSIVRMAAPRFAAEHGRGFPTISAVFDKTPQWSERDFIDAVLALGDCEPSHVAFDGYAPFGDLDRALEEQDAPFFAPGLAMTRGLHETARDRKLAILLDGHGGDETVSHAYGRLDELAKARQWPKLWREMQGVSHIYGEKPLSHFLNLYLFYGPLRPLASRFRRLAQSVRRTNSGPPAPPAWMEFIRQDFAERINLADRWVELTPTPPFGAQEQHLADLRSHYTSQAFEILDRQAAAVGIELRFPFWDKDFVEFCLNLPAELKLDDGWTRLIVRKAMEGRLPPKVQWRRSKLDFRPHVILGMLKHHTKLIEDVIFKDTGQIGAYMNLDAVAGAYRRMQAMRENVPPSDLFAIYRAVVLSEWNRKNL